MNTGQAAMAVTGGYVLGRLHKARWAMALTGAMVGRRLRAQGGEGGESAGGALRSAGAGKLTDSLRGGVAAAGKAAALAALAHRMDAISDRLAEQTANLRGTAGAVGDSEESAKPDTRDSDEAAEERDDETEPEEYARERHGEGTGKRRGTSRTAKGSGKESRSGGAARTSADKRGPSRSSGTAQKSADRKAAGTKAPSRRTGGTAKAGGTRTTSRKGR